MVDDKHRINCSISEAAINQDAEHKIADFQNQLEMNSGAQTSACLEVYKQIKERGVDNFDFTNKKILVVDDESYNCQALFAILKSLQLRDAKENVLMAYSGKRALQILTENSKRKSSLKSAGVLERGSTEIGLILTDCSMPRMDGYSFTK